MNFLKNLLVCSLVLSAISFSSCNDDEDCVAPDLVENIVGVWTAQISAGDAEFKADGTLIDPDDVIIGVEINGVNFSEKTYSISGTTLTATASAPNDPSSTSSADFEITQNECNELKFSVFGLTETLKRK